MATITANMGLTKWDSLNDSFSHAQLAANWQAVDDHDHTPGKGKLVPYGGLAPLSVGSTNLIDGIFTTEKIADDAVTAAKLADGAVTSAHIATGAGIPDSKLSSPTNSIYRLVHQANARGTVLASGSTYILGAGAFVVSGSDSTSCASTLYFDDADLPSTLTPKLRLRAQIYPNATAPTSTFTVGLYSINSVAGGANNNSFTLGGAAVSGSTLAFAAPTASTRANNVTADFTVPADGYYALGVAVSVATMVANSAITISAQLQSRHV